MDQVPSVVETSLREYVMPSEVAMDTPVVILGLLASEDSCSMYSLKEGDEPFYSSKVRTFRPSVFLPLLITADSYDLSHHERPELGDMMPISNVESIDTR